MYIKQNNKLAMADVATYDEAKNACELGFDIVIGVSGEHNIGITELLDIITENFTPIAEEKELEEELNKND